MAVPKLDEAINDFSAGELDPDIKRSGSPLIKMGGRQMLNWRTLNSHKKANRPGRSVLFFASGRVEEISVKGTTFFIAFTAGNVQIISAAGAPLFSAGGLWTANTTDAIVYVIVGLSIYITYSDGLPNNVPQVLTWDGVSTWTSGAFAATTSTGGQKRVPFYRISPADITLQPSATTGSVTLNFSRNVLVAGMIGTQLRFCGRQLVITAVTSGTTGTATVAEPLPPAQTLTLSTPVGAFNPGDVIDGSPSGAQGIVTGSATTQNLHAGSGAFPSGIPYFVGEAVTGATSGATGIVTSVAQYADNSGTITVNLTSATLFQAGEIVNPGGATFGNVSAGGLTVQLNAITSTNISGFSTSDKIGGPSGSAGISAITTIAPQPVAVWDQEVMNNFYGWPSSCFFDQSRLGLTNFPALPSGIAWSALGLFTDLYPDAQPDDAIFELAPDQSTVLYVVAGMESSEFVFTDRAIYYIPIGGLVGKPLAPGTVSFNKVSDYGCFPGVQPRRAEQTIVYVKAGGVQIGAVQAPGAYYRPYIVDSLSELHSHLLTSAAPIAIAIPSGPTQFEELYIYIALANGTAIVGRYIMRNGLLEPGPEGKPAIGWMPWNGVGTISWIAARGGDVIFTSRYAPNAAVVEKLDATQYLDAAVFVNNLPSALTPPGGKGPLFWLAGGSVTLIDRGTRFMDTYQIDANGFLIPKFTGGENLASPQLVAGQPWTAVFEPFMPHAPPGPDNQQRTRRRKIAKGLVSVENSTGFVFGPRRVPAYFLGDDPTQPAPLREDSYKIRPVGRSYDPRISLIKDTPGPLTVVEYGFVVTI